MCLLWVDAHGDIETPEVSPSKNMHGMPVSFHIKEMFPNDHYPEQVEHLKWFKPW
jgi:arginase